MLPLNDTLDGIEFVLNSLIGIVLMPLNVSIVATRGVALLVRSILPQPRSRTTRPSSKLPTMTRASSSPPHPPPPKML
jgi:hypothetical protein